MSVSIKYKGNEIAKLTATGTKTLNTEGKYCEDDITVQNTESGGGSYNIGHGLLLDENTNTLSVNTVDGLENEDNTLPITAAAVSRTVGNINALLETI